MLWKPYAPIYPRLVKNVADGLTFEENKEMRNRGLHSPALLKLSKRTFEGCTFILLLAHRHDIGERKGYNIG